MERVQELEREHALLYSELLKALDKLYLLKRGHGQLRDKDSESTLATRRLLQMSIEKSAAMLRTLERLQKYGDTSDADFTTTEDLLASRLGKLMKENYDLDYKVAEFLTKEEEAQQELRAERIRYSRLTARLKELSDNINGLKDKNDQNENPESNNSLQAPARPEIISENARIEELLIALKIHGGYDPLM